MRDVDCCVHIKSLLTRQFWSEFWDLVCMYNVRDQALSRWALSLKYNSTRMYRALASRIFSHLSLLSESVKRYALNLGLSLATPGRNKGSSMSDWWTRLFHPLIQFTTIKVGISKLCPLKGA